MSERGSERLQRLGCSWLFTIIPLLFGLMLFNDGVSGSGHADKDGYLAPDQCIAVGAFALMTGGYMLYTTLRASGKLGQSDAAGPDDDAGNEDPRTEDEGGVPIGSQDGESSGMRENRGDE